MKDAIARNVWAPVVQNARGRWIAHDCIRSTRRGAKEAWLKDVPFGMQRKILDGVTFARVVVIEQSTHDRMSEPQP